MLFDETPYLQSSIITDTRTAVVTPTIGKGIAVNFAGAVAGAGGAVYGITTSTEETPGVRATSVAPVAVVAGQAYAVGARFVLTAAEAINAGGVAGIYQVRAAVTPAAATLTVAEAANVFFVSAQIQPDFAYQYGRASRVHQQDAYRPGYQYYRSIAVQGQVACQVGAAAITAGTRVMSDANGKVVAHTGTNRTIGYAVANAPANGWVNVELRLD